MTNPEVRAMFRDAESLYEEASRGLEAKSVRKAAENAWAARLRTTNTLILSKVGGIDSISNNSALISLLTILSVYLMLWTVMEVTDFLQIHTRWIFHTLLLVIIHFNHMPTIFS